MTRRRQEALRRAGANTYGSYDTLHQIRGLFHMEDMTLGGIKVMVEFLSEK